MANETKTALGVEKLDAVADRGYFNSEEILACEEAGITVTLPKPMTSNAKAEGRFGKQDFRYVADEDVYVCPAGEKLAYHYTTEENGLVLRRYWTNVCQSCAIKPTCTTGKNDGSPDGNMSIFSKPFSAGSTSIREDAPAPRDGRTSLRHHQGQDGSNPFPDEDAATSASEMALHVLAYNLTGHEHHGHRPLIAAMRA